MENPLRKIFNFGLFKGSGSESVIGIDIGTSSIKAVQLKKKGGKAILETYGSIALGPYAKTDIGAVTNLPVDVLSEAVKNVLNESSITTKTGALSIPSASSLVFVIDLPANISDADLPGVVQTEARKYIPVPMSEVSFDFWRIPKNDEDINAGNLRTEVLLVAIHNDIIAKYQEILKNAQITSNLFELEIFSQIRSTAEGERAPTMLIDLGASKTKLSIVEFGVVKQFHIVSKGGADITNTISRSLGVPFMRAEELKKTYGLKLSPGQENVADLVKGSVEYILNEANAVLFNFEKKYNKSVKKVVLIGGGAMLPGLLEKASENLRTEVVYGNPFGKTQAPAFLEPVLSSVGPEFSSALGLALRQLQ